MTRRLSLILAVSAVSLLPTGGQAQELLTNGGLELVSEAVAGRNAVPPGWQMEEGPKVPELPPNLPGTYPGDYNNGGVPAVPCAGFLCGAVDAADYTVWRDHLGQTFQLPNEVPGTSTGAVTNSDYVKWKELYGGPNVLSMAEPGNFGHLILEGDWHMWFQPYNSNRTEPEVNDGVFEAEHNFAHLFQIVPGSPGLKYTMTGWALFENYFPGGVVNLNAANPDGTATGAPFDDGPLSPTDTFFALEFLDSVGSVLPGSVLIELKADGQTSDTVWRQHTLSAIAPAGTVNVKVRSSMIDGVENPLPCDECYQMSFFVDAFSLTAQPAGSGASPAPEPASWILGAVALGVWSMSRHRPELRRRRDGVFRR